MKTEEYISIFEEFKKSSNAPKTSYKIIGDKNEFYILENPNRILSIFFTILLFSPSLIFLFFGFYLYFLLMNLAMCAIFGLVLIFGPPIYRIKVNMKYKYIDLEPSYYISSLTRPFFSINFKDIEKFTTVRKEWWVPRAPNVIFNCISFHPKGNKKKEFLYLAGRPEKRTDHLILVNFLNELLKTAHNSA
jgi:hypothetical protein